MIRAIDDLRSQGRPRFFEASWNRRPWIAASANSGLQKGTSEQGRKQQDAAVAIMDGSAGRTTAWSSKTQRIYQNVALLALDLFARS